MSARPEEALFSVRVQTVAARLRESEGLASFVGLVPVELLHRLLAELSVVFREGVYTPAVTVWMFLSQVLSGDHSYRDTVARLLAWRQARRERLCSPNTGAYCVARGRLPEELGPRLVRETGQSAAAESGTATRIGTGRVIACESSIARCSPCQTPRRTRRRIRNRPPRNAAWVFPACGSWWSSHWRWEPC